MLRISAAVFCLAFGLCLPLVARGGPVCQGRWVSKGMSKDEVRELCGEPACVRRPKDVLVEKWGIYFPLAMDEEWIYNPGTGRFVEYIRFYQGEVVDVRSDGFGWTGDRDCNEIPPPR